MNGYITVFLGSLSLLFSLILLRVFQVKAEKARRYEIEKLKIQIIITNWQIKQLEELFDKRKDNDL